MPDAAPVTTYVLDLSDIGLTLQSRQATRAAPTCASRSRGHGSVEEGSRYAPEHEEGRGSRQCGQVVRLSSGTAYLGCAELTRTDDAAYELSIAATFI